MQNTDLPRDTTDFLVTLLFDADNVDDKIRPLINATIYDFHPEFVAGVTSFLKGFRVYLGENGFNLNRLDNLERSFGGSCYWSLSGAGVGFFDENDDTYGNLGGVLQQHLDRYSCRRDGVGRFYEMSHSIMWFRNRKLGRYIDCDRKRKFARAWREDTFGVSETDILRRNIWEAGKELGEEKRLRKRLKLAARACLTAHGMPETPAVGINSKQWEARFALSHELDTQ